MTRRQDDGSAGRPGRALLRVALVAVLVTAGAATAWAAGNEPGDKNRFSVDLGVQAGFAGHAPAGAKLFLGYERLLKGPMWLDLQVDVVMGRRWGDRGCYYSLYLDAPVCDAWNWHGVGVDLAAGLAWRFRVAKTPKLVPFVKANLVIGALSFPRSSGLAVAAKGTGGLWYYLRPNLALGLQVGLALGLGYLGTGGASPYLALDLGLGVEIPF